MPLLLSLCKTAEAEEEVPAGALLTESGDELTTEGGDTLTDEEG